MKELLEYMNDAAKVLVSVVIPSYKSKETIFDALSSVYAQEAEFSYEVIVVDSTGDDTAELVKRRYPQAKVIDLKQRAFPGTARNAAIAQARGRYIAFTDTDCIVDKYWLKNLVAAHKDGYRLVGGFAANGTPRSVFGTLDYLLEFSELMIPYRTTNKDHFGTCNMSVSREIFDAYGLFADQVKGSDNIFLRKIHQKGETLLMIPSAVIWHRNRTNLKKILRNQYDLGIGSAINRKKYNLKGKIFIQYPILIPLLPFAKAASIGSRLLRYSPKNFIKFVLLLPLIFFGLTVYTIGFIKGRKMN